MLPSGVRPRIRSTIRGKSFWPYFATRTSVSKSTSVMSFASLSVLRNLTAAERESLMSSVMLPLVSNSSPTCISGPLSRSVPRAKYLSVCFWPSSMISKSSAFRSVRNSPFLSTTVDAEGGEVDAGAERRRLCGERRHAIETTGRNSEEKQALPSSDLQILHPLKSRGTP